MIYLHLTEISEEQARKALHTLASYFSKKAEDRKPRRDDGDDEAGGCAGVLK